MKTKNSKAKPQAQLAVRCSALGSDSLLFIFQTVPFAVVALRENETVALAVGHQTGAVGVGSPDYAVCELGILNVDPEPFPDPVDFFPQGCCVVTGSACFIFQHHSGGTIGKVHFAHAGWRDEL